MAISVESQSAALGRLIEKLRAGDLVRSGVCRTTSEALLLIQHLCAARSTFEIVAGDERIRRYLKKLSAPTHEPNR